MAEKVDPVERFLGYLKSSARPSKAVGVVTEVFLVANSKECFVREQLNELRENGQGIFSRLKHRKDDYLEYQCERHNKPRGRSSGLSTQTRANRCTAFVSFKFVCNGAVIGCIRRFRCRHNGHDPSSKREKCVGAIDKDVTGIIETLAFNGKNPSDIMKAIKMWAMEKGHGDVNDRRFHPRIQDVNNVLKSYRRHLCFDSNDLLCVEQLLKHELCHCCLSYHPLLLPSLTGSSALNTDEVVMGDKFHVMLQSPEQAVYLQKKSGECQVAFITLCGSDGIFREKQQQKYCDKEQRQFSVYIISIISEDRAYSVPVASVLTEQGSEQALVAGLMALREKHPHFYPSAFMTQRDEHLESSLRQVWSDATLLWAWPTVLQMASDWVMPGKSGQSGDNDMHSKHLVLRSLWRLKFCASKWQFARKSQQLLHRMDKLTTLSPPARKKCQAYLETEWISCGDRWSDFGRSYLMARWSDLHVQLAALDRLYLKQQLQFGACGFTQKLDLLLLMLHHSMQLFFTTLHDLQPSQHTGHRDAATVTGSSGHHCHTSSSGDRAGGCLHKSVKHIGEGEKAVNSSEEGLVQSHDDVFAATSGSNDSVNYSENCPHDYDARHKPLGSCDSKQHSASFCDAADDECATASTSHLDPTPDASSDRKLEMMPGKSAESGSRLAGIKGEMGGELAKAIWLSEGVCVVPSDSSLFVWWRVDFVSMLCSCPSALMAGMCKHLHAEPKEREAKIVKQRKTVANDVTMKGWCYHQHNRLYFISFRNYLYTVDTLGQSDQVMDAADQLDGRSSIQHASQGGPHCTLSDCVKLALKRGKEQDCLDGGCHDSRDTDKADSSDRDDDDDMKYSDEMMEQVVVTVRGRAVQLQCGEDGTEERREDTGGVDVESGVQYEEVVEEVVDVFHTTDCDMTGLVGGSVTGGVTDVTGLVSDNMTDGINDMAGLIGDDVIDRDSDMTGLMNNNVTGEVSGMTGVGEEVVTVGMSTITPSQLLLSLSAAPTSLTATTQILTPSLFVPQAPSHQTLHCGHTPKTESTSITSEVKGDQSEVVVVLPSTETSISEGVPATRTIVAAPQASREAEEIVCQNSPVKRLAGQLCVTRDAPAGEFSTHPLTGLHEALATSSQPLVVWTHQAGPHPGHTPASFPCTGVSGRGTHLPGDSPPVKSLHSSSDVLHSPGLSTQQMIEELAAWARSPDFSDSAELKSAIVCAFDTAFPGNTAIRHMNTELAELASSGSDKLLVKNPVASAGERTLYETSGTALGNVGCMQQGPMAVVEGPSPNMTDIFVCLAPLTSSDRARTSPHMQNHQHKEETLSLAEHQIQQTCGVQKQNLQQSTAKSEGYPECSSMEVIHVTSSTKTCLDDLVRRLEARQQEGDRASHASPSPAKKQKLHGACDLLQVEQVGVFRMPQAGEPGLMEDSVDTEKLDVVNEHKTQVAGKCDLSDIEVLELPSSDLKCKSGSSEVMYNVQSNQEGKDGEVIYIVAV